MSNEQIAHDLAIKLVSNGLTPENAVSEYFDLFNKIKPLVEQHQKTSDIPSVKITNRPF